MNKNILHSGIIWIASGILFIIYEFLNIYFDLNIPGLKEIINLLNNSPDYLIFIISFLVMFIEGLYILGNFFPGSSIIITITSLSQYDGNGKFILIIFIIFLSWTSSGIINMWIAKKYKYILEKRYPPKKNKIFMVKDNILGTWFPSFRSNYEVSQILEGGIFSEVLKSSLRVKFFISIIMGLISYSIAILWDVKKIDDNEGLIFTIFISIIMIIVGVKKIKDYKKS